MAISKDIISQDIIFSFLEKYMFYVCFMDLTMHSH